MVTPWAFVFIVIFFDALVKVNQIIGYIRIAAFIAVNRVKLQYFHCLMLVFEICSFSQWRTHYQRRM